MSLKNASGNLDKRKKTGTLLRYLFQFSTVLGIIALFVLVVNIINGCFGLVALEYEVSPSDFMAPGQILSDLEKEKLIEILKENTSKGLYRRFDGEKKITERNPEDLIELLKEWVFKPEIKKTWTLMESLFNRKEIRQEVAAEYPRATIEFRSWLAPSFIINPQSSKPLKAGIRTAILGTLWMILITVIVAFPLGVGAAIYLEEYARDNWLTRLIQVNIYNLAGVPSIIYGLLGLAVFVRIMEPLTSGMLFGFGEEGSLNGRTVLSAGLTLSLLILPIIIINAQEAIRAVPVTLRYSSYGLGATKWQTIWHHVLPGSFDRILTGTILAVSRVIGETAPLVVIGASTFIAFDPVNIFSKFTTLPIQIYQWTARPQSEFRNLAAAAIIVLLILLLSMNAAAIIMRNRIAKKRKELS